MKLFGWKTPRDGARPALSTSTTGFVGGGGWPQSYEAQVREGYGRNPIAQRSVRLVAEAVGERAGRTIETSLIRAAASGKLGFEEMKAVALKALEQIASASLRSAFGGTSAGGGLGLGSILASLIGLPGRATGGPVAPGAAYVVGERGPELFMPTSSGRIETAAPSGGRDVRVAITVNAASGTAPTALAQSSRQVARAVKAALAD